MTIIEADILMADDEFRLIRDYIYNHCGISFDTSSKFLLEKRLSNRVRLHQFKNFKEYYRFLRYDSKSSEELSVVIATLILESGQFRDWNVEIFGNDISQRVLQVARKGVYTQSSFRGMDDRLINKYFERLDGKYKIKDEVKNLTRFGYLNLMDRGRMSLLRNMDTIFCRNVLIYFDPESKKKVIQNFYEKLDDGSYLLLGHAESMINISTAFILQHLKNDMV